MLEYVLAALVLSQSNLPNKIQRGLPPPNQITATANLSNDVHTWMNSDVSTYLGEVGLNRNAADIQLTSPLIALTNGFEADLLGYSVDAGFDRIRRLVRGLTLNDYLNIDPNERLRLFQEDIATERLRQIVGSNALTSEMVEFINTNYGTGRMTAMQTMDALIMMHRKLTEPEDPFVAPPLPAENVVLTFPVSAQVGAHPAYWTYDRTTRTMTIVASEDGNAAGSEPLVPSVSPQTTLTIRGWAIEALPLGQPAMDVVGGRQMLVRTQHVMGFGQIEQSTSEIRSQTRPVRVFRHSFSIEPEAARALSGALELQVFGKARPWRDDQTTLCVSAIDADGRSATRIQSCFLTGVLETYRVIDNRDGSVIHEWSPN